MTKKRFCWTSKNCFLIIKAYEPTKQPKIIPQKPKYKLKDDRESKANCNQQLELIRRHNNQPQNCLQLYEIKILISKKYDQQLNFTRSYIKNKLHEISKEFREF